MRHLDGTNGDDVLDFMKRCPVRLIDREWFDCDVAPECNIWLTLVTVLNFDKAGRASDGKECFLINQHLRTTATSLNSFVFLDLELHATRYLPPTEFASQELDATSNQPSRIESARRAYRESVNDIPQLTTQHPHDVRTNPRKHPHLRGPPL